MENELKVGIGDMKMTYGSGVIATYALGSCVGISFYDTEKKLGALLHVLLPEQLNNDSRLYKYADTGIDETLRRLKAFGLNKKKTVVKIAGGAHMFDTTNVSFRDIGSDNIKMVRKQLQANGFAIDGEDVGGDYARTMRLDIETGRVTISTFGRELKVI